MYKAISVRPLSALLRPLDVGRLDVGRSMSAAGCRPLACQPLDVGRFHLLRPLSAASTLLRPLSAARCWPLYRSGMPLWATVGSSSCCSRQQLKRTQAASVQQQLKRAQSGSAAGSGRKRGAAVEAMQSGPGAAADSKRTQAASSS